MDILKEANIEQQKVITHENGPQLVVAGAGTGKTKAITFRIAWLIETGRAKPDEILALTFTEKAATEMQERTDQLLAYGCFDQWTMTFHGFADRVLRQHGIDIGLSGNYKLLDEVGQWLLVRKNLAKFNLDYYRPLGNPAKFIHALLKHFSRCKDELILPEDYLKYAEGRRLNAGSADFIEESEILRVNEVANAYHVYQNLLLENNALDFGDLINYSVKLFKERPVILRYYRNKFKHLLVDEFQDTNYAQYELVKMLAAPRNNLTVVGDDDQSIYKFRGASVSNIMRFKEDFKDAKEVVLMNNYRTVQPILDLAYKFIQQNNPDRLESKLGIVKKLISQVEGSGNVQHCHCNEIADEAQFVVDKILELKKNDETLLWSDFAILVRANDSADIFNQHLAQAKIPFQFVALKGLYQKPVILDIINYFRLLDNYHESAALFRVLSAPFVNVQIEDIIQISYQAKKKAISLWQALKQARIFGVSQETVVEIERLVGLIEKHANLAKNKPTSEVFLKILYDSGYLQILKNLPDPQNQEQMSLLDQFFRKIKTFEMEFGDKRLVGFMEMLEMEIEAGDCGKLNGGLDVDNDAVRVMTIHSAKGLEFEHVFIVSLVDQRFPTIERKEQIEIPDALIKDILPEGDFHLQEERRLFYVAMTRAKKGLYFTSAENYGGSRKKKISQFLVELGYKVEQSAVMPALGGSSALNKSFVQPIVVQPRRLFFSTYYSFSQLNVFTQCPMMYKFSYVLKIVPFGKPVLTFGNVVHAVLHRFLEEWKTRKTMTVVDLFGEVARQNEKLLPLSRLMEIYKESWIDEWYADEKQRDDYFKKGKGILENFYDNFIKEQPKLYLLEQNFKFGLDKYSIVGKIDRVDAIDAPASSAGKGVEIIDYKTGEPKLKLDSDLKKQLLLYQIAAEESLRVAPVKLTYYYLEGKDATKQRLSFVGTNEEKDSLKQELKDKIKAIEQSDFRATPCFACQYCDYRNICEHKK
ncbi:MAG: UvrD-helicase domain-containing protein [Candidatus Falkowbacteria bacterium]